MNEVIKRGRIELAQGDITQIDTDAIVNPSNTSLILGAGVSGAIRAKGGEIIQDEMSGLGGCPVGGAKVTGAGSLGSDYVIHAVGPRMGEGDEEKKLKSATVESLKRAEELGLTSIAFPAISTGIFGFPFESCADIMLGAALEHFESGIPQGGAKPRSLERVVFCLWGDSAFNIFRQALDRLASA